MTSGSGRKMLIQAVRDQYEACLIDEFQDTDPAQYRIFATLFARARSRFGGCRPFFMIGDPKQAIYGFRGGDIFAYLTASQESDQQFTLDRNFRSSPLLVQAVNDLFAADPHPFVFKQIPFYRVGTPDSAVHGIEDDTGPVAPLQFDFLPRVTLEPDSSEYMTKEAARRLIPDIVAKAVLCDMTAGYTRVDRHGVKASIDFKDMAVLVRTNLEAKDIQAALSNAMIPCYLSKTGSVFDAPQAMELHDLLWAVFRPDHPGFVKAALNASVFGFNPDDLAGLSQTEIWQWQDRFRHWKHLWESRGFIAMIQDLLHCPEGLLDPASEMDDRGLTNFYHLVELISQTALNRHLSLFYLLKWYQAQLFVDTREETEDELRLESDRNAVAIVTIHKSKGLEYPVVYLPYLWSGSRPKTGEPVLFHDPDNHFRLCQDLRGQGYQGPDTQGMDRSADQHRTEDFAEQRRLLYVAVTRASALCRIVWAGIRGVAESALGRLIHPQGCDTDDSMIRNLNALAGKGNHIQVNLLDLAGPVPALSGTNEMLPPLSARSLARPVQPLFQVTSFSTLVKGHPDKATESDLSGGSRDEWVARDMSMDSDADMALTTSDRERREIRLQGFPKGAGAGDFFHAVLEHMDFQWDTAAVSACVSEYLHRFGFSGDRFSGPVTAAVQEVVTTPLSAGGSTFCLNEIALSDRMTEAEFFFDGTRGNGFHPGDLFAKTTRWKSYARTLQELSPNRLSGFIKGFIDLVVRYRGKYYLVDYKSNFLGDFYEDYHVSVMASAMESNHYVLQYHIYTRALHRYLSWRMKQYDPEADFGGVLYLFIRGMHPDHPGAGVFFDRPIVVF